MQRQKVIIEKNISGISTWKTVINGHFSEVSRISNDYNKGLVPNARIVLTIYGNGPCYSRPWAKAYIHDIGRIWVDNRPFFGKGGFVA